jgi:hypothetical protein
MNWETCLLVREFTLGLRLERELPLTRPISLRNYVADF